MKVLSGVVGRSVSLRLLVLVSESKIVSLVLILLSEAKKSLVEELEMLFVDLVLRFLAEVDVGGDAELCCLVGSSFAEGERFGSEPGHGPYFFALFVIVLVSGGRSSRIPTGMVA